MEYRVEHLRRRLADGDTAELGIGIDLRGDTVVLTGSVATIEHRERVRVIAEAELAGVPLLTDLVVTRADPPDRPEVLP
ncbi:hypothetical protein [Streptomyces sp. NPDC093225]|uniref:hypothetical protein n=1 Tax=Streptomyces sp. NPDC093225 TaxID=3366034 RepID=UPI00380B7424